MEARLAVEVYVSETGHVCIKQDDPMDEPSIVALEPNQVPRIIEWLQECLEEIGRG
jgi:hypothetical protein